MDVQFIQKLSNSHTITVYFSSYQHETRNEEAFNYQTNIINLKWDTLIEYPEKNLIDTKVYSKWHEIKSCEGIEIQNHE